MSTVAKTKDNLKKCICMKCALFKENNLGKGKFCLATGGKQKQNHLDNLKQQQDRHTTMEP